MNSFYEYFAAWQKLAAYRQAKRMQRGVKLGFEQPIMYASTTKFVSAPISIKVSDFSIEFYGNTYGSYTNKNPSIFNQSQPSTYKEGFLSVYQTESGVGGIEWIIFEKPATGAELNDSIRLKYKPIEPFEKFHFVITRQGTTVKVYINGELKVTKEQSAVKDLGDLQLAIANSSDVGFVRVWNYALSADDVTAHYNNGDPMGYVVPKVMRDLKPMQISGNNSYTWTGLDDTVIGTPVYTNPFLGLNRKYRINVTVSNYEAGAPYFYMGTSYEIPAANGTYDIDVKVTNPVYTYIFMYGGPFGTDRRITLTINSITPIGLLAEYLPQNLMKINKPSSPDISFPTSKYTESKNTFTANNPGSVSNTTFDNPAENGFSGPFIKDTAITRVSMYCAYHNRPEYLNIPIRLKVEFRCNADIYDDYELSNILLRANESDAKEAYINYGPGNGFLVSAPNPDAWLEIRVLSIMFWDGISFSWLDSAKQLPLSDEYMEPLFQSIGGYDMTANGAPEILYKE